MSNLFKLHLFGGFRLERRDGSLVNITLRKGEALVAYLAAATGGVASRERLATLLWGESEQHRARQSLRQVLFALTREFAEDDLPLLRMESQLVALNGEAIWVDVGAFEALVARGEEADLERALRLYSGEFLADLSIDAPGFEEWLTDLRREYQDMAMKASAALLDLQEARGEIGAAVDTALWALRLDPYREDLHRRLMSLYAAKGMRSSALSQYRACADLLARELEVQPDPETTALYRAILDQEPPRSDETNKPPRLARPAAPPPVPLDAPAASDVPLDGRVLVGRDAELERLASAMTGVRGGTGACLAVVGEAGIGRTALVERFSRGLAEAGTTAVVLQARSGASDYDWSLWADLLNDADLTDPASSADPLPSAARHEIAVFKASGEAADPIRLRDAAVELIRLRSRREPLCLILEDLHRADAESLRLFEAVVRRLRDVPLLMLATARSGASGSGSAAVEILAQLEREGLTSLLRLEPLPLEDLERFVAVVAGRLGPEMGRKRLPALEPAQLWAASQGNPRRLVDALRAAALVNGAGRDGRRPVWAMSAEQLAERYARLDPLARRVAAVAAAIGPRSPFALVLRAAGLDDERAADAVEALVEAGILTAEGEDLVFARSLARRVVLDGLLMPRRRALHAEIARAIEAHFADDPTPQCPALAHHWWRAGETQKAALWVWRVAEAELDRGADRAARSSLQWVIALARPQAPDDSEQAVRLDARIALAEVAERTREFEVALTALRRLEARLGQIDRPRHRALILAALSRLEYVQGRSDLARDYARRALAEARSDGGETLWYSCESLIERLHLVNGAFETTIERLGYRMQRSRRHALRRQEADTAATLGVLCGLQGNFESAEAACETAVYAAEAIAGERRVAVCLQAWATVQAWQGRYDSALEILGRAERLAESRGDLLRLYALGGLRGFALAGAKRFAEALESFDGALTLGRELGAESYRPLFMAWLAEAQFGAGQGETALLSAREAFRLAAEANQPWASSIALRTLGRVLAHPEVGDLAGALKAARAALAEQEGMGLSFEIARTTVAYAKILRASGDLKLSSAVYARASLLFQKMRMTGEYDSAKTLAEALRPTGG